MEHRDEIGGELPSNAIFKEENMRTLYSIAFRVGKLPLKKLRVCRALFWPYVSRALL